jgi:uncharacterized membrane protein
MNRVDKNRGALLIIAPFVIALIVVWIIYDPLHMLGRSENFARTPVWLWVIGVGILGSAIAYGTLRARHRSPMEEHLTQKATRDLYRREENDRRQQDLP